MCYIGLHEDTGMGNLGAEARSSTRVGDAKC